MREGANGSHPLAPFFIAPFYIAPFFIAPFYIALFYIAPFFIAPFLMPTSVRQIRFTGHTSHFMTRAVHTNAPSSMSAWL